MTLGNREYSKIQNVEREKMREQSRQRFEEEAERDIHRL